LDIAKYRYASFAKRVSQIGVAPYFHQEKLFVRCPASLARCEIAGAGVLHARRAEPYCRRVEKNALHPKQLHPEPGLYTHAFSVDPRSFSRLVVISGQISIAEDGALVGDGDFEAQFHQVYGNLEKVMIAAGAKMSNIISLRTFMTKASDLAQFHQLRKEHYPRIFAGGDYPPNTLLIVDQLYRPELRLEIEGLAAI
jgi:enamine deaminase RidA (YjgF/YER057c/UK114 family)